METVKFYIVLVVHKILKVMPDRVLLEATMLVTPVAKHLIRGKNRMLKINNTIAFSDVPKDYLHQILKQTTVSYIQSTVFDLKYGLSSCKSVKVKFEFDKLAKLKKKFADTAVVCVVPHLGMSLLGAKLLAKYADKRVAVLVRGFEKEGGYDEIYIDRMGDENIEFIKIGKAMGKIEDAIEDRAILVLAFDVVDTVKHTEEVEFFGRKVAFPTGPVWLADKYNLPIITGYSILEKHPFRIKMKAEIPDERGKKDNKSVQWLASRIETYIKENPGKWCLPDNYFGLPN